MHRDHSPPQVHLHPMCGHDTHLAAATTDADRQRSVSTAHSKKWSFRPGSMQAFGPFVGASNKMLHTDLCDNFPIAQCPHNGQDWFAWCTQCLPFFLHVGALLSVCVPRGTSHRVEFVLGSVRNEPDKHEQRNQTKNPKTTQNTNKNQQPQKQADQAHVRTCLKKAKGADPKTNTEVKRGAEFISSRSQYRTSRTKLHSVCAGRSPTDGAQRMHVQARHCTCVKEL